MSFATFKLCYIHIVKWNLYLATGKLDKVHKVKIENLLVN